MHLAPLRLLLLMAAGAIAGAWAALDMGIPWPLGRVAVAHMALAGLAAGSVAGAALALAGGSEGRRQRLGQIRAALAGAGLLCGGGLLHFLFAPSAPSVTLIVIDCMRADLLNPEDAPGIDALAARGWRFTQARAASSWTRSSMPALMSGRPPAEHGLYRVNPPDRIRKEIVLLPQPFRRAGWATAAFLTQPQLAPAFGYARGFGTYRFAVGEGPKIVAAALRWHALFRHVPRYLQLHFVDIHGPYTARKKSLPAGTPGTELKLWPSEDWRKTIQGVRQGKIQATEQDFAAMHGRYRGEMRELDAALRPLWEAWAGDGTLENGWLVVTADHGEQFGEHGAIEHLGPPREAVIRVPLLVLPPAGQAIPGQGAGRTADAPVSLMDVAPTLWAASGLPIPAGVYGRDLQPLIRGEVDAAAWAERPQFAEEFAGKVHHAAVWSAGWKLIRGPQTLLFDLSADPGEARDLSADRPDQRARLEGMLSAYFDAAQRQAVAGVDWAQAAASGQVWPGTRLPDAPAQGAAVSPETMRALEALGYLDGADDPGAGD